MNPGQKTTSNKNPSSMNNGANNPFARALAETEKRSGGKDNLKQAEKELTDNGDLNKSVGDKDVDTFRQEQEAELKKRQMREKLHRKVNPVEQTDIFNAREAKVKKELEEVRKELKLLAAEFSKFYKEIDITLEQNIAHPGQEGIYHKNFFQKLKAFIMLLRQKVRSARTWARQAKAKKKKQQARKGRGLDMKGNAGQEVHNMLNPERFNAYSGA